MLKIGIMGMQHAHLFSAFINGINEEKFEKEAPGWTVEEIKKGGETSAKIFGDEVKIVKVWDENSGNAKKLAEACLIDEVVEKRENMVSGTDAIMLLTGDKHLEHARRFLKAGIPIYVDKPFARNISDAEEMIKLAKESNTILFSTSVLRFAKEIEDLKNQLKEIGSINYAVAIGPCHKDIFNYGIHTVEMVYSIVGGGIEYVHNIGESQTKNILKMKYKNGKVVVIHSWEGCQGYKISVYGKRGSLSAEAKDSYYFFKNGLTKIVEALRENKPVVPLGETLEIVKILSASSQSLNKDKKVILS